MTLIQRVAHAHGQRQPRDRMRRRDVPVRTDRGDGRIGRQGYDEQRDPRNLNLSEITVKHHIHRNYAQVDADPSRGGMIRAQQQI